MFLGTRNSDVTQPSFFLDLFARLNELANQALRSGLEAIAEQPLLPYRTPPADAGRSLVKSVDDVAEVLATIEGEDHR